MCGTFTSLCPRCRTIFYTGTLLISVYVCACADGCICLTMLADVCQCCRLLMFACVSSFKTLSSLLNLVNKESESRLT